MSKKIYVGNLPFKITEEEIAALFQQAGSVEEVTIIVDRETGRSKGFGFVTMAADQADKAIEQFNGYSVGGRALTVNEARPLVRKEFGGRSAREAS